MCNVQHIRLPPIYTTLHGHNQFAPSKDTQVFRRVSAKPYLRSVQIN